MVGKNPFIGGFGSGAVIHGDIGCDQVAGGDAKCLNTCRCGMQGLDGVNQSVAIAGLDQEPIF